VKINEIKSILILLLIWFLDLLLKHLKHIVIYYYSNFSLIFMQDSGFMLPALALLFGCGAFASDTANP
jgi:hypothetical protein